jgi:CheY-like chemotaxis protein
MLDSRRVLIADDNFDWARGMSFVLADRGFEVQTAHDGRDAVDTAAWFRPSVAVLDIRMPRMTGYDVARSLGQLEDGQRPTLVAVTAWPGENSRQRALLAGFDRYLAKPSDPAVLLELLNSL